MTAEETLQQQNDGDQVGSLEQQKQTSSEPFQGSYNDFVSGDTKPRSWWYRLYTHPWFQIFLISFICFCNPGMYNALGGLGGSGQVNYVVASNATVALLSCTAATALLIVPPIYDLVGPRVCLLIGGWTYALYSGSLLNYNRTKNGPFVIGAGALLGIGASFLWVSQGSIMTSYVPEKQKGRAIALFWCIFNFGGAIGSLASFGLNYHSKSGTVNDGTYIALMVIMLFGWVISVFICPPSSVNNSQLAAEVSHHEVSRKRGIMKLFDAEVMREAVRLWIKVMIRWRILFLIPLFFSANVFYSYQQVMVNGQTFNIRTRSLNGALYWIAQMVGGLLMGFILDMNIVNRRLRARIGWAITFVTGMAIWGGGYAFQKWNQKRIDKGLKQDIDYKDGSIYLGPMFLYFFYGMYDAIWQSFSYWLIGTESNDAAATAVLVGAYKTFQAVGAAMAWRINAQKKPAMTQFAMCWGLCIGSLVLSLPSVWTVSLTSVESPAIQVDEKTMNADEDN